MTNLRWDTAKYNHNYPVSTIGHLIQARRRARPACISAGVREGEVFSLPSSR
jgi:hypothetical protein